MRSCVRVPYPQRFEIVSQQYIELWCNGNIEDSGSFVLGLNPNSSTKKSKKYHKDFFENQIHGIIDL